MLLNLLENTADKPQDATGSLIIMIVLIVAIIGLFVWQTISGKKKQKEAQEMVSALKKGDKVKTIGGICGYVVEINDTENTFVLETGTDKDKSYVKFDKGAIYQTAPANATPADAAPVQAAEEKVEEVEEKVEEPTKKSTASKKKDAE